MVVHALRQSLLKMSHGVALKTDLERKHVYFHMSEHLASLYRKLFGRFGAGWGWLY